MQSPVSGPSWLTFKNLGTSEKESPNREVGAASQEGGGTLLLISLIFARLRSSLDTSLNRPKESSINGSQAFPGVRQTGEKLM